MISRSQHILLFAASPVFTLSDLPQSTYEWNKFFDQNDVKKIIKQYTSIENKKASILKTGLTSLTVEQTIEFAQLVNVRIDESAMRMQSTTAAALYRVGQSIFQTIAKTNAKVGHAEYLRLSILLLHEGKMNTPRRENLDLNPTDYPEDIDQWSTGVTCRWLNEKGLGVLQTFFVNHDIDGQVLFTINFSELFRMEPRLKDCIERLEIEIQILRERGVLW